MNDLFDEYEAGVGDLFSYKLGYKVDPLLDNIETHAEAAAKRERVVSQLIRCDDPKAYELASTLQTCAEDHPCGSGICPPCDLAARKVLIAGANVALHHEVPLAEVWMAPRSWRIPIGTLANVDLKRLALGRERVLQKALPGVTMFGLVNVALSGWDRGPGEWQISISVIAEAVDSRELQKTLSKCFPCDPSWEGQHGFRQIFEADRLRVICRLLEPVLGVSTRACSSQGYSDTITNTAPPNAALEAVLSLHRFPVHKRLILNRISRAGGRKGSGLMQSN